MRDPRARFSDAFDRSGCAAMSERKLSARTILGVILGGLVVLFAALNSQSVTVHWLLLTTSTPLIVVILGCFLVGFGAGWLVARRAARRRAR